MMTMKAAKSARRDAFPPQALVFDPDAMRAAGLRMVRAGESFAIWGEAQLSHEAIDTFHAWATDLGLDARDADDVLDIACGRAVWSAVRRVASGAE